MDHRILWVFGQGIVTDTDELANNSVANVRTARRDLKQAKKSGRPYTAVLLTGGVFQRGQRTPIAILMAEKMGDVGIPVYCACNSTITRHDVTDGLRRLEEEQIYLPNSAITVISEFWHALGVWFIFLRAYRKWIRFMGSGHRIGWKEWGRRLIRLGAYFFDPLGTSQRSYAEAEARRASA
jgi:hypothetical protein